MPEIARFYGIVIAMFYDEHNPPHFHAIYGKYQAMIRIDDLALINGKLPSRALGLVMEWAAHHKEELAANWDLARKSNPIAKIKPLR